MLAKMKILAKTLAINENSRGKWTWWREIHIAKFQTDESSQEEETKIQCRNKPSPPSRNRKKDKNPITDEDYVTPLKKKKDKPYENKTIEKGERPKGPLVFTPVQEDQLESQPLMAQSKKADRGKKLTVHPDGKPLDRQIAKPRIGRRN